MRKQWLQRVAAVLVLTTTIVPLQISTTFAQTIAPATAPTVASVSVSNDHQVSVTFSKTMNSDSVTSGVSVLDEGLSPVNATVAPDPTDKYGKRFIVSFPANDNLYASATSRTLKLVFSSTISDSDGNYLSTITKSVTVRKDTTLPTISKITFDKDGNGNVVDLVLNLSKGSAEETVGAINTSGIVVQNMTTGVNVTDQFSLKNEAVTDGDHTIKLDLQSPQPFYNNYKFFLPAKLVTDNTQGSGNSNLRTAISVNFGTYTNTFKITQGSITPNPSAGTIQVDFGRAVTVSATTPSNYTIGGKSLPSNTWISLDRNRQVATIILPRGFATTDNLAATFRVANVRDVDNILLTTFTGTVPVYENTSPILQSAVLLNSQQILLTYSENMTQSYSGADAASEFIITNNYAKYKGTVTPQAVPGYPKEVLLNLGTPLNLSYRVTLKAIAVASGAQIVDASLGQNDQVTGTTKNVPLQR